MIQKKTLGEYLQGAHINSLRINFFQIIKVKFLYFYFKEDKLIK